MLIIKLVELVVTVLMDISQIWDKKNKTKTTITKKPHSWWAVRAAVLGFLNAVAQPVCQSRLVTSCMTDEQLYFS